MEREDDTDLEDCGAATVLDGTIIPLKRRKMKDFDNKAFEDLCEDVIFNAPS